MNNKNFAINLIDKINLIAASSDKNKIAVHEPDFINTNALNYVSECILSGWVSSAGKFVNQFEDSICRYTGSKYAIAVSNGTVALRLALFIIGVKREEEVILPPLSFVATANAISHLGAIPHFVDIEKERLGIVSTIS